LAAHSLSLVQAPQVKVRVVSQIGVEPEQSALLKQPTHWPALGLALALGTQNGTLALQAGDVASMLASVAPPASMLPVLLALVAPGSSQPTHWFWAEQNPLAPSGQSLFCRQATHLPVMELHIGVVAGQACPPPSTPAALHPTHMEPTQ
jgi:hypothetical protein